MDKSMNFSPSSGEQWISAVRVGLIFGVVLGILLSVFTGRTIGVASGVTTVLLSTLAFGFLSTYISSASILDGNKFMSLNLSQNENLLGEGAGSHMVNNKGIGGKMAFTNLGVHFVPHKLLGNGMGANPIFLPYDQIQKVFLRSLGGLSSLISGNSVTQLVIDSSKGEEVFNIYEGEKIKEFLTTKINNHVNPSAT